MPTEPLKSLNVPNTGDLVGTWGVSTAGINPNFVAVGGMFAGVQTLSMSSATTFTLSAPSGSITPGTGPNQAQNAILKFTGTLTGDSSITFPLPGYYIVENNCVIGANQWLVQARAVGVGNVIAIPPGEPCHIYIDGTNAAYVNMGRVGSYLDLAVATTPRWFLGCTVAPYLLCNGATFSTSAFPALGASLGSSFGGNGVTTFAVPDLLNRWRIPMGGASGRITGASSGIDGTLLGSLGGSQNYTMTAFNMPSYTLPNTLAISDTRTWAVNANGQNLVNTGSGASFGGGAIGGSVSPNVTVQSGTATIIGSVTSGGSGLPIVTVPPAMVACCTFIKT